VKGAPELAVALGAVLNVEFAATDPTVYETTSEPEAPVSPAWPPEPFTAVLLSHCVVTEPQFAAFTVMFEKVPDP
jgi:hypothetical protein